MEGCLNFLFLWEAMLLNTVLHILTFVQYIEKEA